MGRGEAPARAQIECGMLEVLDFLYLAARVGALGLTLAAGAAAGIAVWLGVAIAVLTGK